MSTVDQTTGTTELDGARTNAGAVPVPSRHRGLDVRGLTRRFLNLLLPTGLLAALIIAWEVFVNVADVRPFLLPAPSVIWNELVVMWPVSLRTHTWVTLQEAVAGFVLGCLLGFVLAVSIAYSKFLERTIYPLIVASQAVPKIALAPLFVVWLGFGMEPKILVTVLLVFFPIVVTTVQGLMSVDTDLLQLMRSVSASQWQIFRKVRLPHALPYLVSGMKIGVTLAVVGAVVGEWVGSNQGLGYQVVYAQSQLQTPRVFAAIALLVAMGVLFFGVISILGKLVTPWTRDEETRANTGL